MCMCVTHYHKDKSNYTWSDILTLVICIWVACIAKILAWHFSMHTGANMMQLAVWKEATHSDNSNSSMQRAWVAIKTSIDNMHFRLLPGLAPRHKTNYYVIIDCDIILKCNSWLIVSIVWVSCFFHTANCIIGISMTKCQARLSLVLHAIQITRVGVNLGLICLCGNGWWSCLVLTLPEKWAGQCCWWYTTAVEDWRGERFMCV